MPPTTVLADRYRSRKIVIYEHIVQGYPLESESNFTGQVSGLDDVFEGTNRFQLLSLIRAHLDNLDGLADPIDAIPD